MTTTRPVVCPTIGPGLSCPGTNKVRSEPIVGQRSPQPFEPARAFPPLSAAESPKLEPPRRSKPLHERASSPSTACCCASLKRLLTRQKCDTTARASHSRFHFASIRANWHWWFADFRCSALFALPLGTGGSPTSGAPRCSHSHLALVVRRLQVLHGAREARRRLGGAVGVPKLAWRVSRDYSDGGDAISLALCRR